MSDTLPTSRVLVLAVRCDLLRRVHTRSSPFHGEPSLDDDRAGEEEDDGATSRMGARDGEAAASDRRRVDRAETPRTESVHA